MNQSIHQQFTVTYTFPVLFTRDVFSVDNSMLSDVIKTTGQSQNAALVVVDREVARLHPNLLQSIEHYAQAHNGTLQLVAPPFVLAGGESCKNEHSAVSWIHGLVEQYKICRHSFIIAIGGGALLDMVGYAAATAHRGVRLVRLPTTVLAQNDAGVGVKNGVNAFGRKNFIGTFAPPFAVINDALFLQTLPERDLRAGIAEAIKVALIQDADFFDFLQREQRSLARFIPAVMDKMIFRCAELHVRHIGNNDDPFEKGSSRPLDFGHWIAHKLEDCSNAEIRHGEAVAIGIAVDSMYSNRIGLLDSDDLGKILSLLDGLGFDLYHPALARLDINGALQEFREHLGGELSIPLLKSVGQKLNANEIDVSVMSECIARLASLDSARHTGPWFTPIPVTEGLNQTVVDAR